ncbi:ABC transmembrane type-1 domain-containing protein [Mycoplasma marinum]|uniref:Uncharacterized protein n=1 Tax=Mycoplasma marinum TaxID=1937190 RepID=A0A4V6N9K7_9MOLU|nr:hypothetical protein C4B24_00870 [Mycoplasma marinum]
MGFIVNALGSVFRTLLDPILKMFWSLTYEILIRGPLQFLQSIKYVLRYKKYNIFTPKGNCCILL